MTMETDVTGIIKALDQYREKNENIRKKAIQNALAALRQEINETPPKAPLRTGYLRGAVNITITPHTGTLQYHAPYARRWHEAINDIDPITNAKINWTHPNVGPKYVEQKLQNTQKYQEIMTETFKQENQ